jgi:demethylmenaquinone methyltransferase/2-methoxy-6-polyprenyl-1,4-benzoquinol methylase
VLELSEPKGAVAARIARFHVHSLVPRLGAWLSRAPEYRYLAQSIAAFPPPAEFLRLLADAGLEPILTKRLGFGACHLFVARTRSPA